MVILMAGPLCFLMKRVRRIRSIAVRARLWWKKRRCVRPPEKSIPKSLPTVATFNFSPSSSSNEARRLALGRDAQPFFP